MMDADEAYFKEHGEPLVCSSSPPDLGQEAAMAPWPAKSRDGIHSPIVLTLM
jgi:hypothetical protein